MRRKRLVCGLLAGLLLMVLSACGGPGKGNDMEELVVFAAASLTEALRELAPAYEESRHVRLVFNFDSSGTLKTQIQEGAACDVFLSAGQKQMNQLDAADTTGQNTEGLDLIDSATRRDLLENKVVLSVPADNPRQLTGFAQWAQLLAVGDVLLAMGNSDVPVGQYTQEIFAYYGLDEEQLAQAGCITYGSNVKEVTAQVAEGSVDCGVIYRTDAVSAGLAEVDAATEAMCGRVIYPAAVCKNARLPEAAEDFLAYLATDEAMAAFGRLGFTAP